jgi:hypothetical protein
MKAAILILTLVSAFCNAQNNVHLFSGTGIPFTVLIKDKTINKVPQTNVTLTNITDDTLLVKIDFNGKRSGVTLYLLDKGKPASNKEFTYKLEPANGRVTHQFMGMRSAGKPDAPSLPVDPQKK